MPPWLVGKDMAPMMNVGPIAATVFGMAYDTVYTGVPITVGRPWESNTFLTVGGGLWDVGTGERGAEVTPGAPDSSRVATEVVSFYTSKVTYDFYMLFPDPFPGGPPRPVTCGPYGG